ncbi:hypothetical protein AAON49_00420 [Pseudotenacibaculum sp. MALMAid0570]|uniref:hypothetical protein n=1 Tax=Pseudotenacibaculum sp. MALMAid0570 TaxID=3143938 RepID=UPI0032DE9E2D
MKTFLKFSMIFLVALSMLTSCNSSSQKNKNEENESTRKIEVEKDVDTERIEQIKKVKYFLNNPSVTDENGINYDLEVKTNEIKRKKIYESEKIHYVSRYDSIYIIVSSHQIQEEFQLISNGDIKDVIKIKGYYFESKRSDRNGYGDYCSDNFTFYPELNTEETKKNRISDFTGVNCGMGSEINSRVKNERIKAVQSSGILVSNNY